MSKLYPSFETFLHWFFLDMYPNSVSLLKCKVVNISCLVFSVFTCSSYSPWTSQVVQWFLKKKAVNIGDTRVGFNPCVRKILWSRKCQPVPVFMPGKPLDEEPGGLYSTGSQRFGHNWVSMCAHTHTLPSKCEPRRTETADHTYPHFIFLHDWQSY